MNITTEQLQTIRPLLSKEDKESIAEQADKSSRTVEAVLQGNRANDEIERLCVKKAKENWTKLGSTFSKIESKNLNESLLIEEFQKLKENQISSGEEYNRYMDVYLDLVHVKFESEDGLWEHLSNFHPDIIGRAYWCINLFVRLLGVSEERAVAFYNSKI
jgi:hypothetical protein